MKKLDGLICRAWDNVLDNIERKKYPMSSEKTLVFNFMIELYKLDSNVIFDFEYQAYEKISGTDKYLDLLVYLDESEKIAIEFKLPKSIGKNNSNQTETRKKIYRDLFRLNYLVTNEVDNIKAAYFLCGTNETAYLNEGNKNKNKDYKTYDGYSFDLMEFEGLPQINKRIKFDWENVIKEDNKVIINGRFAWLFIAI